MCCNDDSYGTNVSVEMLMWTWKYKANYRIYRVDVTRGGLYSRITEMGRKLQACLAWHEMGDHGPASSVRGSLHQLVPV